MRLEGLIAATFTPFDKNGVIDTAVIPRMVDLLIANGINGIYVCGSTGEGHSLTTGERMHLLEHFVKVTDGRILVMANVGHNSLEEAKKLTKHAADLGVDAISAAPPTYYSITSNQQLIEVLKEITEVASEVPFYYYHIPAMTGVNLDMVQFLKQSESQLPSLRGIKFTSPNVDEFQACMHVNDRYQILFGRDEMLLSGLAVGTSCMIGSTFNFMPALYSELVASFHGGNLKRAAELQYRSVEVINAFLNFSSLPAQKAIMRMMDMDCGGVRLPLVNLSKDEEICLRKSLDNTELFKLKWNRK